MKVFSPSLKHQLKDCILAVLWPKKDIYRFFRDCSVPIPVLKTIADWDSLGLSRAAMVETVFDALGRQPDNGTMHFDIMLDLLSSWSYFDAYWFTEQQKLGLEDAKQKIAALKSAKSKHIDAARKRVAERQAKATAKEERHKSLLEMQQDFHVECLGSLTPQSRGYAFEKFLGKMARYFGLQVTNAFKVRGAQIDGTVKYDGENYTIEAKWEHQQLSNEPLFAFCHKLETNMHGRGIFISINGYTPEALHLLERAAVKNTVLMDGEDITLILSGLISFPDTLDKKIHAAQTRGQFYIHPITGMEKIKR